MSRRCMVATLAAVALLGSAPASAVASLGTTPEQTVAGLAYPWEIVPLPSGPLLVTERSARTVRVVETNGNLRPAAAFSEPSANKVLGMALSPAFAVDNRVYLYESFWSSGSGRDNPHASRVIALTWNGTDLVNPQVIFDQDIWSDGNHDGGRIAFGPDGKLYITTGDVHDKDVPQNLDRLNGKILRINEDGSAPADNPFPGPGLRRFVWSYGHRHPEGIAWDASGRMWETEHGPSRGAGPYTSENENTKLSRDEINRIEPGCNYGWPVITGEQTAAGMSSPVLYSGTTQAETWAPGGLAVGADGRLYVPALAGKHLRSYAIAGDTLSDLQVLLKGSVYGRLRTAVVSGTSLWLATSNATDSIVRFPFDPPAAPLMPPPVRPRAACPGVGQPGTQDPGSASPGAGATTAPPAVGTAAAAPAAGPVAPVSRAALLRALERALTGAGRVLAGQRAAGLATRREVRLRLAGMPAGRGVVELDVVRGRRPVPFAVSSSFTTSARSRQVSLRTRASGRRTLRRLARGQRRVTLELTARLRTRDGRLVSSSRRLALRGARP